MKLVISNSGHANKPFLDRINLLQGDITTQEVDAICMVMPQHMDFSGRLNESIHAACGNNLDDFILEHVYKPQVGEVYALPAFGLPARHILLGILPHFRTEFDMNEAYLSNVTRKMMELARCMLLTSVAFPAIASGRKGYPKPKASRLVCQGITDRLQESFEEVRIVCEDEKSYEIFDRKLKLLGWEGWTYIPPSE